MKQLNYIDLFAGASGMSEGFTRAGFTPIAHIEMNEEACFTIRTRAAYHYLKSKKKLDLYYSYLKKEINREEFYNNIPEKILNSVINIEINDNTIKDLFKKINAENKKIDLIIGGPPCQAYSLLGRHQENIEKDPRNKLYIQYGRFLKEFNPKAFVFENVPGMLSANKGQHFRNLKTYFKKLGYEVHYDTLDASDYGVVQARKRIIIVGWKKENDFGFPEILKIKEKYTVNEAFEDLPILKPGEGYQYTSYKEEKNSYLEKFDLRNGIDFVTQHLSRPHNERDLAIYKTVIRKWNNEQIRLKYPDLPENLKTHKNESSFIDRYKVVDGTGVSHTVVAHIAKDGHYYIHPDEEQCRSISVREAARLQSFPDDFYFEGSRSAAFKQIGNAVPPLMAYAIAQKMKKLL
ncbi:DNA (cytosine-5-)-methyltransferase [Elizabethkingia miricola]|uniref:DNA cytosine methyltransferase n=1 Tax=Elizabethkingia TaxID=308865 RepID=UPI000999D3CE|nr:MULTISPECIES: DNA cytosine methyltransferase [Elizabethkingia]MCL1653977.1 DNA cytosine methyltransferase [Elizabethkingia miricola]OPC70880.1 DNA (cytosine-5-)-methyltransferase [Elizabethkingia miricola]OPC74954.1 DNA (cytosine-5-)-methyltransferase [Elizabethkingia miricola]QCO48438.1 DNA cytosine methyltransferase [Elizabethkingia sp. 2-6]